MKKFKASPDAWAQLVKQLAFHKMFNRPGVTYESAQTRKYQLGRTEIIRSASNETKAWAEAMLDPEETVRLSHLCHNIQVTYKMFRMCTVLHYSTAQSPVTSNTWLGQLMARAWTVTCLV